MTKSDEFPPRSLPTRRMVFAVFPGVCLLDLAGPSDVFANACEISGEPLYECVVASITPDLPVRSESGVELLASSSLMDEVTSVDTLVVCGGSGFRDAVEDPDLINAISRVAKKAERVSSVCTGAFLLAEAGLLDGHRATTHWSVTDELAAQYPLVDVAPDEIFVDSNTVDSGTVATSAGVTAGIDLALAMVARDHGEGLARTVARHLVVYLNRSGGQSQFSERLGSGFHTDSGIDACIAKVHADPTADLSVSNMATAAAMSERNFARRFKEQTGTTPARWVERVRVDVARAQLESGDAPPAAVAAAAGFASYHTMRQAFERVLGVSPARYRNTH